MRHCSLKTDFHSRSCSTFNKQLPDMAKKRLDAGDKLAPRLIVRGLNGAENGLVGTNKSKMRSEEFINWLENALPPLLPDGRRRLRVGADPLVASMILEATGIARNHY